MNSNLHRSICVVGGLQITLEKSENIFIILLSEYLREYVGKNMEKPEYPIPFSLSFSLSGFSGPLPHSIGSGPPTHPITNSTTNPISSSVSSRTFSIRYRLSNESVVRSRWNLYNLKIFWHPSFEYKSS